MDDTISRQTAISAICNACGKIDCDKMDKCEKLQLPPANCSEFPNNSDTISRQDAIDTSLEFFVEFLGGAFDEDFQKKLIERINALSSAGPKIIYCRDCKYKMLDTSGDEWICSHPSNNAWRITADHYCGYAERREA